MRTILFSNVIRGVRFNMDDASIEKLTNGTPVSDILQGEEKEKFRRTFKTGKSPCDTSLVTAWHISPGHGRTIITNNVNWN